MSTATPPTSDYTCKYCEKSFSRETSLAVHVCEQKRRRQEEKETGVQLGLQSYLRFYDLTQGSSKFKTFDDFAKSPYYRAFVKFGRHVQAIRAVNPTRFIDWVIKENKKIDHWCKETVYAEYLNQYIRVENVADALERAIKQGLAWHDETGNPPHDYLRFANPNLVCFAITTGRISPWIVYNCDSGTQFLNSINQDHIGMIWSIIDADFWSKKFKDYPADTEYVREIMTKAGW